MAESALSEEAMLTGLRDIRLPADAPGGLLAEALAALALGLLLAVMLGCLLRLVTQLRPRPQTAKVLDDLDTLPEEDQRLALLKRLKAGAPRTLCEPDTGALPARRSSRHLDIARRGAAR